MQVNLTLVNYEILGLHSMWWNKKHLYLLVSLVLTLHVAGQNLIPNPGFEHMNRCLEHEVWCSVEAWVHTTQDLVRCEDDPAMEARPLRGKGMMTVLVGQPMSQGFAREYLQVPILCPLVEGETYQLRFYLKPEYCLVPQFGVYFSEHVIRQNRSYPLFLTPHFQFHKIIFEENPKAGNGWVKVEVEFTASGQERYLILGNFDAPERVDYEWLVPKRKARKDRAVYLIDQVSLKPRKSHLMCDFGPYLKAIRDNINRHPYVDLVPPYPYDKPAEEPIAEDSIRIDTFILPQVQFAFDQHQLLPSAFPVLDTLAESLLSEGFKALYIHGHTDEQGTADYNMDLSYRRANTVYLYLIAKGVPADKLSFKAFGFSQPKVLGDSPKDHQINRRVEFIVLREWLVEAMNQ